MAIQQAAGSGEPHNARGREALARGSRLGATDVGSAKMYRVALLLPLLALASCDTFYGFVRHTEVGPGFDIEAARALVAEHPDCDHQTYAWKDGTVYCYVRRGEATADVTYEDRHLGIVSLWTGRLPEPGVLDESAGLQAELIDLLRARFPELPPATEWSFDWIGMDAQQAAAVDRVMLRR